jgi:hypothetical protein
MRWPSSVTPRYEVPSFLLRQLLKKRVSDASSPAEDVEDEPKTHVRIRSRDLPVRDSALSLPDVVIPIYVDEVIDLDADNDVEELIPTEVIPNVAAAMQRRHAEPPPLPEQPHRETPAHVVEAAPDRWPRPEARFVRPLERSDHVGGAVRALVAAFALIRAVIHWLQS